MDNLLHSQGLSLAPLRNLFQWFDDDEEVSGYTSSATISSVRTGLVSANKADNNDDDLRRRVEAQEQTFKAQQEALDNIQQMLAQLLINQNTNDTGSNLTIRSITTMNVLRQRGQRKAPQLMSMSLKASRLRLYPSPRGMN